MEKDPTFAKIFSGLPRSTVLEAILFIIFIKDIDLNLTRMRHILEYYQVCR
jgi:hypothetical protein